MIRANTQKTNSGFTLVEILIALLVFTIISIILTGTLHTIFDFQKRSENHAKRLESLQLTFLLLSRDIEQIISRPSINAKGIVEDTLFGNSNSITFTHAGLTNPDATVQRATLQRTHYFLDKDHIVRETWPVLDQTKKSENSFRNLAYVLDMQISYLDEGGAFLLKWPPSDRKHKPLPKAIRIALTLEHFGKISQLYVLPR